MPGPHAGLLHANEPESPWEWNVDLRRYRDTRTGRFIGARQMVVLRDQFTDAMHSRTDRLTRQLVSGEISREQWVYAMRDVVKGTWVDTYVLARGGRGQMTQSDYGRLGVEIKQQYAYLRGMEADLRDGRLSEAQIAARARSFVDTANQMYAEAQRRAAGDAGMDLERNILNAKESCAGCLAETARGWVPVGSLVPVGSRTPCGQYCRCHLDFRRAA